MDKLVKDVQRVENYIDNLVIKADADVLTLEDIIVHHRSNNKKRDYLFVNRAQGKHIPVSPRRVFRLVENLVDQIKTVKTGDDVVVIGFAETATALGNLVAEELQYRGVKVTVVQTTREDVKGINLVNFEEEHSHATSQKLMIKGDKEIPADSPVLNAKHYIIVEDEITTGNTVINMVSKLREKITFKYAKFTVASVCNWQSDNDIKRFNDNKIEAVSLISGKIKDANMKMTDVDSELDKAIKPVVGGRKELGVVGKKYIREDSTRLYDTGISKDSIFQYERTEHQPYRGYENDVDAKIIDEIKKIGLNKYGTVRVIGTEEFMYYPLKIAKAIEDKLNCKVKFHATTRSPIDIIENGDVRGIVNGVKLNRPGQVDKRYLYNIDGGQDVVVVISDTPLSHRFREELAEAFNYKDFDVCNMIYVNVE